MEKLLGGEIIARMLANEGVERVFGIIDGTYFGLYSSLEKHGIRLISPRHEACAVHMAGAYARVTGKLGVCMASNGPGVANVISGVAVENAEGNRVLLLTSSRRSGIGYPDRGGTYQYFDQVGVIRPMSKWSGTASTFGRIPEMMKRAFRKSWQGRPGVVHVDVPENLINAKGEAAIPKAGSYRRETPLQPDPAQVDRAAELLMKADKPLIHAGSGVIHSRAHAELLEVAELLGAPVCTSWGGRGAIPETSELALPMTAMDVNNLARNEADVVLTLGSRIGETDWWGKAPYWRQPGEQKHIQVDLDEDMLGLNKPADIAIFACARLFLMALRDRLRERNFTPPAQRQETIARYQQALRKEQGKLEKILDDPSSPLTAAHVTRACQAAFPDNSYIVIDGGNTAVWANLYHQVRTPGTVLGTPKMGMLGAGVAQALGAKIAKPDREVYCIIGDGAFGFNLQEIETAVRNDLKVTYIICVDNQWGMVKINQHFALKPFKTMLKKSLSPEETINADLYPIQYDKLAEAMGAHGERVSGIAELKPALERARAAKRCAVIHVDVEPVKHMWAPNLIKFKDMHQEPKGR
ncbi:MAG: thiamine pyrophosphate-binding protein [Candidatus Hydrogenedentes bacterium]|nr:thiamine pyrophosphate-binding protein [Candidatus Hydrogenedentota bacterium]